jgi:hypothetical protein
VAQEGWIGEATDGTRWRVIIVDGDVCYVQLRPPGEHSTWRAVIELVDREGDDDG